MVSLAEKPETMLFHEQVHMFKLWCIAGKLASHAGDKMPNGSDNGQKNTV
jgi:hypothetical protein